MLTGRKVILYIAASLDGYIAKPGDDLSFLSLVSREGEDYGYADFMQTVDTVIMGRKTFDWVMSQVPVFPHANLDTYILTHSPRPDKGLIRFYNGDPKELIAKLKSTTGKNIFIDGGAEAIHGFLSAKLIDEFYISFIPVLLGEGIRLFKDGRPGQELQLTGSKSYPSGLVMLHYIAH